VDTNEYIKIDAIDIPSWKIGSDPTELKLVVKDIKESTSIEAPSVIITASRLY
jgi:hypothetical protein